MTDTLLELAERLERRACSFDEKVRGAEFNGMPFMAAIPREAAALDRAAARALREADAALEPFDAWSKAQPADRSDDRLPLHTFDWNGVRCRIGIDDLRRARLARGGAHD